MPFGFNRPIRTTFSQKDRYINWYQRETELAGGDRAVGTLVGQKEYSSAIKQINAQLKSPNDGLAEEIFNNALKGKYKDPKHKQIVKNTVGDQVAKFRNAEKLYEQGILQTQAQIAAIAGYAYSTATRIISTNATNKAITSGRVIRSQRIQKNLREASRFAAGATSLGALAGALVSGNLFVGVGAVVGAANFGLNIYQENARISAQEDRGDTNAQYHNEIYGNIVRRGNR